MQQLPSTEEGKYIHTYLDFRAASQAKILNNWQVTTLHSVGYIWNEMGGFLL